MSLLAPAALAAAIGGAGCADEEEPPPAPEIAWAECEGVAGLDCGALRVPRDHDDPFGPTFEIPVVRRPADDPARRIGAIVFHPGGPGSSGAGFARSAWVVMPAELRARFDIVGFDPRGEAGSTPGIDCAYDIGRFASLDPTPDDDAEREAFVDESRAMAEGCAERSGALLAFVGTDAVVRDMDLLREALGEEKLSYFGFSYGTFVGEMYAEAFPGRVRAMVLDGVIDPSETAEEMIEGQAIGFEEELHAFLDQCAGDAQCAFHSGGDPTGAYDALLAAIEAAPLPAPAGGGRALGPGELAYGVAAALYRPSGWPALATGLAAAQAGDGGPLLALADGYLGRGADGSYGPAMDVYYAVTSVDVPSARDPEEVAAVTARVQAKAPRIGAYLPYSVMPSEVWGVAPWRQAGPVSARGAAPALVIGGTHDPATPYASAVSVAKQLPGSALLTRDAHGHTSFLMGSTCVDEAVTRYLVDLELPPPGTVCSD